MSGWSESERRVLTELFRLVSVFILLLLDEDFSSIFPVFSFNLNLINPIFIDLIQLARHRCFQVVDFSLLDLREKGSCNHKLLILKFLKFVLVSLCGIVQPVELVLNGSVLQTQTKLKKLAKFLTILAAEFAEFLSVTNEYPQPHLSPVISRAQLSDKNYKLH